MSGRSHSTYPREEDINVEPSTERDLGGRQRSGNTGTPAPPPPPSSPPGFMMFDPVLFPPPRRPDEAPLYSVAFAQPG